MPDVLILVGSESDKPRIEPAFEILTKAGFSSLTDMDEAVKQAVALAKGKAA